MLMLTLGIDILFETFGLAVYMAYFFVSLSVTLYLKICLPFYLTCFLAFDLTYYLTSYLSFYLSFYPAYMSGILSYISSGIPFYILSDIAAGILPVIYCSLSNTLWRYTWGFVWVRGNPDHHLAGDEKQNDVLDVLSKFGIPIASGKYFWLVNSPSELVVGKSAVWFVSMSCICMHLFLVSFSSPLAGARCNKVHVFEQSGFEQWHVQRRQTFII